MSDKRQVPTASDVISNFNAIPQQTLPQKLESYKQKYDETLTELELKDIEWVIEERPKVLAYFKRLLVCQNVVVFALVSISLMWGNLKDLQLVFAVLVAATLTETAVTIKFMVEFLFTKITYKNRFMAKDQEKQ